MNFRTEKWPRWEVRAGRVVTRPPRKWARAQGADGYVEWWCGRDPGVDEVAGLREARLSRKKC